MKLASVKPFLPVILIAALAAGVYANTLTNKFVYDDYLVIVDNPRFGNWRSLEALFTPGYFRMSAELTYRPVVTLSYFVDYAFWRMNPVGYHLTNVVFHALNAVLLYLLLRLLLKRPGAALAAALLFALHPVASETVNAISYREDLFAATFSFCALLAYLRFSPAGTGGFRAAVLFLVPVFLALFSKESALVIPLLLLLIEVCFPRSSRAEGKGRILLYAGLTAVIGFYLVVRFFLIHHPRELYFLPSPLPVRLMTTAKIIFFYLGLLLFPWRLSAEYLFPFAGSLRDAAVIFSLAGLAVIFLGAVFLRRRFPEFVFGAGWFFLALLPVADIVPLFNTVAERYLYFPAAGFCLVLALAGETVYSRLPAAGKRGLTACLVLVLGLYSVRTVTRNRDWKDYATLVRKTIETVPGSARFHTCLGFVYAEEGKYDEAILEFKKAIKLEPYHVKAYHNLANVYQRKGLLKEAEELYRITLKMYPYFAEAHNNLGFIYQSQGKLEQAVSEYESALEIDPDFAGAHSNLGNVYYEKDQLDEAVREYRKAIKIKPNFALAHNNLGKALQVKGMLEEAIRELQLACRLEPDTVEFYADLGSAYRKHGMLAEAAGEFEYVLKSEPGSFDAHHNLGFIYHQMGRLDEAIREFEAALSLKPDYQPIRVNLGMLYESKGMTAEAAREYSAAIAGGEKGEIPRLRLGNLYQKEGRTAEAFGEYEAAVKANPDSAGAHNQLGFLYQQEGRPEEAIREYLEVIRIEPGNVDAHNNLGVAYVARGEYARAREHWEKALSLDPELPETKANLEKLKEQGH